MTNGMPMPFPAYSFVVDDRSRTWGADKQPMSILLICRRLREVKLGLTFMFLGCVLFFFGPAKVQAAGIAFSSGAGGTGAVAASAGAGAENQAGKSTTITLNGLELSVDRKNGSLVELGYPSTGTILRASPKAAGLLDVAYPVPAFLPMRLASRFSHARVLKDRDGLTIVYSHLGPSRSNIALPSGKVSATIVIRAAPDGKSVILSCRIENRSAVPIPQTLFPDLWGLRPFAGG